MSQLNLKQANKHTRFYSLLGLLMALIITRYSLQIDIPRASFLAVILFALLIGDRDETVAMCICCVPLHESVDFYYAVVFCVAAYVMKYPTTVRLSWPVIPIFLLILWELIHCFGTSLDIVRLITEMVPLMALLIFLGVDVSDIDYSFVVQAMSITTILAGFSLLLKQVYLADFNVAYAFARLQRLGQVTEKTAISGGTIHPNALGIICVFCVTGLMQLRTIGRGNKYNNLLAIILLVLGSLTASRTYLACLAMMIILLLFSQQGSVMQKMKFLCGIILVLLIALVLLSAIFPELLEYFYKRFFVKDITTGRMDLMEVYHKFIVSEPKFTFFGIGLHNLGEKVTNVYRIANNVPHNGIQEVVLAWGLPGVIILAILFLCMIWKSSQICRRQRLINFIPFLILLFKIQAGQLISSGYTMVILVYAYLSLSIEMNPIANMERQSNYLNRYK